MRVVAVLVRVEGFGIRAALELKVEFRLYGVTVRGRSLVQWRRLE